MVSEARDEEERRVGDPAPALSIVIAWPRFCISTISVTPGLRACFAYDALATARGTVWSESAETRRRGRSFALFA